MISLTFILLFFTAHKGPSPVLSAFSRGVHCEVSEIASEAWAIMEQLLLLASFRRKNSSLGKVSQEILPCCTFMYFSSDT